MPSLATVISFTYCSGVAYGNDGVVQSVHAHADGAAAFDVRLLHENDAQARIPLFGFDRRHRAAGAPAQDEKIGLDHFGSGSARHSHVPP